MSPRSAGAWRSEAFYDWGGGLVWLALDGGVEAAGAQPIRAALERTGGHASLIRAPEAVRRAVPVFHPQPAGLAALSARVKDAFDPKAILNPGRMYPPRADPPPAPTRASEAGGADAVHPRPALPIPISRMRKASCGPASIAASA